NQARQLDKSSEQMSVVFVSRDQAAEVVQPADGPLDLPTTAEPAKAAAILCRRLGAVVAMRTNQFDTTSLEAAAKRIAVGGNVRSDCESGDGALAFEAVVR